MSIQLIQQYHAKVERIIRYGGSRNESALRKPFQDLLEQYAANRDLLLAELPKAGFSEFAPADGAFYLYCDVGRLTNDSAAFCRQMLDQAGVAATPGTDFDPGRGNRFVRFSFAGGRADMELAVSRLQRWRAGR